MEANTWAYEVPAPPIICSPCEQPSVTVAQLVGSRIVIPGVVGSSPIGHPICRPKGGKESAEI